MLGLITLLGYPRRADAEAPRVLLIRPPSAGPAVKAALVRVQGELVADGFAVVSVEAAEGTTSAMAMSQAEEQASATTVGLFLNADGSSAELWVVDTLTKKTVVRHVNTAGREQSALPEELAVRTVELLRASLLELAVQQKHAARNAPSPRQRATDWAMRPLASARPLWGIETGAAMLWSPGQLDPAFLSVARGRVAVTPALHVRLSFVGLGTHPRVSGTGGSAAIAEWCGLAELLLVPFQRFALHPLFSLGAGAFHSSVNGDANAPYLGLQDAQWAFVADAGVGTALRLASRLELALEGHAQWVTPQPVVRFVTDDAAKLGQPSVVGSLSLLGWL